MADGIREKNAEPVKAPTRHTARGMAMELLEKCQQSGAYSNIALDGALRGCDLSPADRGLLTALFYGVIERQVTLDYLIDTLSSLPPQKIDLHTRMALRLGLYQLRYMDKIPPHAAVSESVELSPRKSRGFVNAILRSYLRAGDSLPMPSPKTDYAAYLSVTYGFPKILCETFLSFYSREKTQALLAAFDCQPGITVRVNTLRTDVRRVTETLRQKGAEVTPCRYAAGTGLHVRGLPVSGLALEAGDFFVQDEASQICVAALDPRPGQTLIDACACPGSKSFGAAIAMQNTGRVLSFDLHENKLSLVRSGAKRLGISILTAEARDGRRYDETLFESADRVLCDVPCSGYGVLAKKPEIRYKDPAQSRALPDIQLAILENNAQYVKPGGVLVYSTCTLLPAENQENVRRFLRRHPEFSPTPFAVGALSASEGMITLTPDEHGTDGFFVAKMTKCGSL